MRRKIALTVFLAAVLFVLSYFILSMCTEGIYSLLEGMALVPRLDYDYDLTIALCVLIAVICGFIVYRVSKQRRKLLYFLCACLAIFLCAFLCFWLDALYDFAGTDFLTEVFGCRETGPGREEFSIRVATGFVFPLITVTIALIFYLFIKRSRVLKRNN